MASLADRITNLSPDKRKILESLIAERNCDSNGPRESIKPNSCTSILSFAQQRLWFLDRFDPGCSLYNMPGAFYLQGLLGIRHIEVIKQCLNEIIRRHNILRATFLIADDHPIQVIVPAVAVTLPITDLTCLSKVDRELQVESILQEEAEQPFNLAVGPLVRSHIIRLNDVCHLLLLTMHHIVSDGWSVRLLVKELEILYRGFINGTPSPLQELSLQYTDYACWQREWLQGRILEQQVAYWKRQLADAHPVLELPVDRPRSSAKLSRGDSKAKLSRGDSKSILFSPSLTNALRQLSQREGATLFMTLLASFYVLLHRYTHQDRISIGSPVAGRNRSELENLIGCFVNTLVIHTNLSGNPSFRELLARVKVKALESYSHQDLPFEKLVEELQPERTTSHTPLFQVMLILYDSPQKYLDLPGLTSARLERYTSITNFDMTLIVSASNNLLEASLHYKIDSFEGETIERVLRHLKTVAEGAVENPVKRISELPLLTEIEESQIIVEWNSTEKNYPTEKCLHQVFEEQAERSKDAVAVVFGDKQLTYGELHIRSKQLARHLRSLGVQSETLVGVLMERSAEMVIGLLGILKSGGTYVPLDPAYPRDRISFIIEDAQLRVLLTQRELLDLRPGPETQLIDTGILREPVNENAQESLDKLTTPNNLAYVIYTSGSTGRPKGVQITHRSIVNFLRSMRQQPGLTARDILLSITTLCFDISALEIFLPLLTGARLELATREEASNGKRLSARLIDSRATMLQATPASWRLLLEDGWSDRGNLKILCGGESLAPDLGSQLLERGASVWNLYGPTETTVWTTVYRLKAGKEAVPIGRPIANTRIYPMDSCLQLAPVGVTGELHICGISLARGYLNRPELTASNFVPIPFGNEPGARMYKTGDLARFRPDGNLEFLGRVDRQVKLHGFRIEPGEIESALAQHPALKTSLVVMRENMPGHRQLVAYLIAQRQPAPDPAELRHFLKGKLPEYTMPHTFVFLESLPLTSNGKVDYQALPTPSPIRSELKTDIAPPRNSIEETLVNVWTELLGLERVSIYDNFFELGGHSLLATQIVSRIHRLFQIDLPLRDFFESPTIASLGKRIESDPRISLE